MKRLSDTERVAYHEAGHAVMRYELHLPFKRVSIQPAADSLGRVLGSAPPSFRPDCETDLRTQERVKSEVMSYLAGSLAENLAARPGGAQRWAEGDSENAFLMAGHVTASGDEASAYVRWLWERTKTYLSRPWVWAEIEALVAGLLEHDELSGPRARGVIKEGLRVWRDAELRRGTV